MEEPTAATARQSPAGPSLRRLVWMTFWFCLTSLVLIRLPHEMSYWMLAMAEKASLEGRTEEALALVERAKPWMPESLLPLKVSAQILQKAGKLDDMGRIDLILQAQLTPAQKAEAHLEKSQILRRMRRWDDAIAEFDKAADYDGELRPSEKRLALLLAAGREEDALREVNQLLKTATSDRQKVALHLALAEVYQLSSNWNEAIREFDEAASLKPDLRPSPQRLNLLLLAQRTEEARQELADLEKALASSWESQASIDNTVAYFSALLNQDLEKALQRAERALAASGNDPAVLDTRGYILHRLGRNEQAIDDLQRAVGELEPSSAALKPGDPRAKNFAVIVYHRSLILEALGKSSEAEQDRKRVRELGFEPDQHLF